jgi:hypothetical protein
MIDHVLYRMYGPPNDGWPEELLYVGLTRNPHGRMREHESKWWWPKVTRITLERFASREELKAAELAEIRASGPRCNILANPRYQYNRKDCVIEGHNPPPDDLCETCADEKFVAWNWLDEGEIEYTIWYLDAERRSA